MTKYLFFKVFLFLFIFLLSVNISSYSIDKIDTQIIIEKDLLIVKDSITLIDFENSQTVKINLPAVKSLEVITLVKDINYNLQDGILTINVLSCCCIQDSFSFDIIYSTDYFIKENEGVFNLNYSSFLRNYIDNLNIFFPENTVILDSSINLDNYVVNDNKIILSSINISKIDVNYMTTDNTYNNQNNSYTILIIIILLTLLLIYYYLKLKKYL